MGFNSGFKGLNLSRRLHLAYITEVRSGVYWNRSICLNVVSLGRNVWMMAETCTRWSLAVTFKTSCSACSLSLCPPASVGMCVSLDERGNAKSDYWFHCSSFQRTLCDLSSGCHLQQRYPAAGQFRLGLRTVHCAYVTAFGSANIIATKSRPNRASW